MKPAEIVLLVFYGLGGETIRNDPKTIHTVFYNMLSDEEFTNAFPDICDLSFNIYGLFPYSKIIDSMLSNLQQAGVLTKHNPYYNKFEIATEMKVVFDKELAKEPYSEHKQILVNARDLLLKSLAC